MIGPKFKNSTFEKANMEEIHMKIAKRYADNFTKNNISKGLLLYGPSGVGKTYATCCIANSLMQQQKAVLVLNLGLYIGELKVNWDQAEQALLKAVENCDLLIIDDFGAEQSLDINKSNWRSEKIYNLIDCCYRNEKPLILSTNLNYSKENTKCQISNSFPDRIKSRILDMCFPVSVIGKNKRGLEEFEFMELLK
jgi:DNA replication protein DnaC